MSVPKVTIATGTIKKGQNQGKEWEAIRVEVGDWSTLIFPKSKFELDYIKKLLQEQK